MKKKLSVEDERIIMSAAAEILEKADKQNPAVYPQKIDKEEEVSADPPVKKKKLPKIRSAEEQAKEDQRVADMRRAKKENREVLKMSKKQIYRPEETPLEIACFEIGKQGDTNVIRVLYYSITGRLDIRRWWRYPKDKRTSEDWSPTSRGIRLQPSELAVIIDAITALQK